MLFDDLKEETGHGSGREKRLSAREFVVVVMCHQAAYELWFFNRVFKVCEIFKKWFFHYQSPVNFHAKAEI